MNYADKFPNGFGINPGVGTVCPEVPLLYGSAAFILFRLLNKTLTFKSL